MKNHLSNQYFGPYYDTMSYNIRVTDPRIQEYSRLIRKIDVGMRIGVVENKNRLVLREGYKTYFIDRGILGYEDTRIPITSTHSYPSFPIELIDKDMVDALNWTANAKYRVDPDFYDFTQKLLYFKDDKGKTEFYDNLNDYRKYIASRGDTYERFKSMAFFRGTGESFSNHPFLDHRARIYDRGFIGPQSGEAYRCFLNTDQEKVLGVEGYKNWKDQVGQFLGGLNDEFEGNYNSLTITGRQKIADYWNPELVKIGNLMLRNKPDDIRKILENSMVAKVDGEELGKFYRFAIESAKIDNHLKLNLGLDTYKTALALEQDATSSGAQVIALTTRNKQLAELSNVIPTTQKKRLYDEIALLTYNDPRFKKINEAIGLTERDLRVAAKQQNLVTLYGAGPRTASLGVEKKLAKILEKETGTLVVKASDRNTIIGEINARIARYERFDPEITNSLKALKQNVLDVFNKGLSPDDELMQQLFFLDSKAKDLLNKMTLQYDKSVIPGDFTGIAKIMSEHLKEQVPIIRNFTSWFGRLAQDYLLNAKSSDADFDWKSVAKADLVGIKPDKKNKKGKWINERGYILPKEISILLGLPNNVPISEQILKRFGAWVPNGNLHDIIYGINAPMTRRIGAKYLKVEPLELKEVFKIEVFTANKLPKTWTNAPSVNFDGKIIEQNFTQEFQERLVYKDKEGKWTTNLLQIPQKTEATWWEELINKEGKINDIADASKARTSYGVSVNHSNDSVLVKQFHMWGKKNNIATSTIHDRICCV